MIGKSTFLRLWRDWEIIF